MNVKKFVVKLRINMEFDLKEVYYELEIQVIPFRTKSSVNGRRT
jgi:hypothetical protein